MSFILSFMMQKNSTISTTISAESIAMIGDISGRSNKKDINSSKVAVCGRLIFKFVIQSLC